MFGKCYGLPQLKLLNSAIANILSKFDQMVIVLKILELNKLKLLVLNEAQLNIFNYRCMHVYEEKQHKDEIRKK